MTLVSVLVAVALLGILAATLATIFGNMGSLYLRSNESNEAKAMTQLVQSIASQRNLCSFALRATPYAQVAPPPPAGTPYVTDWAWDFKGNNTPTFHLTLDHIEINPGGTYTSQALAVRRTDTIS